MNREDRFEKDILRQYIDPENIERAPEGFTSRVMENIRLQPVPVLHKTAGLRKIAVPLISSLLTLALVIIAIISPESSYSNLPLPGILKNIEIPSVSFRFTDFTFPELPGWIPYLLIAILLLWVFDRALESIFHRQR